jgi:hypothetical protein
LQPVFTLFPKLPAEIQQKIWKDAAEDLKPKIVTFSSGPDNIPGLFQACGYTRQLLLKTHERVEQEKDEYNWGFVVLVNFDTDLILLETHDHRFDGWYRLSPFREGVRKFGSWLRKVKKLAINIEQACIEDSIHDRDDEFWPWLERACPLIEEFSIVCDSRITYERGVFGTNTPQVISQLWQLCDLQHSLQVTQRDGVLPGLKFKVMTRA